MLYKVSMYVQKWAKQWQLFSATGVIALCLPINFNAHALEGQLQLHKGEESTSGYSVGLSESLFGSDSFYWGVNYQTFDKVNINWNEESLDFSLDTLDLMLSYRYTTQPSTSGRNRMRPNSYYTSYTFELQLGAGVSLTDNKFQWPSLNEEKIYSEKSDVNPVAALLIHRSFSRNTSMHIGVKHYPEYSGFGAISSVFLGFNYRFGQQSRYRN